MLSDLARTYSAVFAPEFFVLLCSLLLLGHEWRRSRDASLAGLGARVGTLALAWGVAFAIYEGAPLLVGPLPEWGPDAAGSAGLAAGFLLLWAVWRAADWGPLFPPFATLLLAVTVPHLLVTPVWDVSSHVLYAAVPAGYLALVARRYAVLLVVPAGMVLARPLAGAHTWPQSVGGALLALAFLAAAARLSSVPGRSPLATGSGGRR